MRLFRMIFECVTPLHCGGGEEDLFQDQPVTRDAFGLWRIPGSSLAGILRNLSSQIDPELTLKMFGDSDTACNSTTPSLIWCEDATLVDFDGVSAPAKKLAGQEIAIPVLPIIRDHVKLNLETGASDNKSGGKFDTEIVPTGTRFFMSIRCDGWNRPLTTQEENHFDKLCSYLLGGDLDLGGKTANGYGRYRVVKSQYRNLDLQNPQDMQAWLNVPRYTFLGAGSGTEIPISAAQNLLPSKGLSGNITLELICNAPLLIAGGQPLLPDGCTSEADLIFALSPMLDYDKRKLAWRPVIPGTSLKGVLRHGVYNILCDMQLSEDEARKKLNSLFGYIDGEAGQCGKFIVEDCGLKAESNPAVIQHVSIDSFTGGAKDGALFSEEPFWREEEPLLINIHVRDANDKEAVLIFQVLLDLAEGLLSVGSGANRGNGRLYAKEISSVEALLNSFSGNLVWSGICVFKGTAAERYRTLKRLAKEWETGQAEEIDA